jgi:hypothetical protein
MNEEGKIEKNTKKIEQKPRVEARTMMQGGECSRRKGREE